MQLLVIGDVHACYYTLQKLVKNYWDPAQTVLIQLGDLINKGPHTAHSIHFFMRLQEQHPGKVIWLRGNHEHALLQKNRAQPASEPLLKLKYALRKKGRSVGEVLEHIEQLPLSWENEQVLITHAGIQRSEKEPYQLDRPRSILNNREALKPLKKLQVVGHNVVEGHKPVFSPKENAWHIDTGAWIKKYLSALLFDEHLNTLKVIREPRHPMDNLMR